MATQAVPKRYQRSDQRSDQRRKPRPRSTHWQDWWPLVVALAATPFAVKTAEILPLLGIPGLHRLCLLLPFPMLAQQHVLALPENTAETLSQLCMYAQFPIYGLLLVLIRRWKTWTAGCITVLCLHLLAAATAWTAISR